VKALDWHPPRTAFNSTLGNKVLGWVGSTHRSSLAMSFSSSIPQNAHLWSGRVLLPLPRPIADLGNVKRRAPSRHERRASAQAAAKGFASMPPMPELQGVLQVSMYATR